MTGHEIMKELRHSRSGGYCFIKWWRKENDFADFELVDTFLANADPDHVFAGYELLTMEQMWDELHSRETGHVSLGKSRGEKVIRWQHKVADGTIREEELPYDPPSVMKVFEAETRGDTLC